MSLSCVAAQSEHVHCRTARGISNWIEPHSLHTLLDGSNRPANQHLSAIPTGLVFNLAPYLTQPGTANDARQTAVAHHALDVQVFKRQRVSALPIAVRRSMTFPPREATSLMLSLSCRIE